MFPFSVRQKQSCRRREERKFTRPKPDFQAVETTTTQVSRSKTQNTARDVEKAHTAETSAPHENQSVTSAIAKDTIAPSACQKPSPQL